MSSQAELGSIALGDTTAAPRRGGPRSAKAQARLERTVRLDRRFALLTSVVPALGTLVAIALPFAGVPVGWVEVALLVAMYSAATIGLEVGWHRGFAHRAYAAAPPVRAVMAVLGSMAFQGPLIWWVATHRRHHANADAPGDPHSPVAGQPGFRAALRALYEAHSGWTFDPVRARPSGWADYAKDLYCDEVLFRVHYHYFAWMLLGLALPAVLGGLAYGTLGGAMLGFLWGGLVRIFLADHAVRALNSIAHTFGSRDFETGDASRNNVWLVLPTFGQGWHHNHHAFPRAAIMSRAWWQLDPGALVVRALERLGLAWDVRVPRADIVESRRIRPA